MISVPGCLELKIRSRSVRAEVSFLILFIQLAIGAVAPRHLLLISLGTLRRSWTGICACANADLQLLHTSVSCIGKNIK